MKGRFYAPFFYTEYTLDLTVKLARFLRRWQLGVACLDTSRLAALAEDKPRLNLTEPTEITENESVTKAVFAANPLGEYFCAFVLLLLCSLRPYSSLRPSIQSRRTVAVFYLLSRYARRYRRP